MYLFVRFNIVGVFGNHVTAVSIKCKSKNIGMGFKENGQRDI